MGQLRSLVLLHGAPGDGGLWQPVVDALGREVRLTCPTLRWFGPEPWDDDGTAFGTAAHTTQLIELLAATGGPVAVAAWSYSTHVVLNALLVRPDLIADAFLYEPGLDTYLTGTEERAAFAADARDAFGPVFEALQTRGPEHAVEILFDSSGGTGCFAGIAPERRERYLASARMMPLLLGGGQPPAAIAAADLARIEVPVTVAFGEGTRPLFEIASRAVARAVPGARLQIVDGADHMLPEKQPDRFASMLAAWLRA